MRRLCAVVLESAVRLHQAIQRALAGVTERRVPEVVRQGDGFGQVLVQAECARQGARHLRGLHRVRQARPVVVALVIDEDLGLVLETPEGARVDDPVAVALEHHPEGVLRLGMTSPARGAARASHRTRVRRPPVPPAPAGCSPPPDRLRV